MAKELVFTCTGNTCRSPMAMVVAENQLASKATCNSGAADSPSGPKTNKKAQEAVKKMYGATSPEYKRIFNYTPKLITEAMIRNSDHTFVLDSYCMKELQKKFPDQKSKLEYYRMDGDTDVPDPWRGTQKDYDDVLESMVKTWQPAINNKYFKGVKDEL